MLDFNIEDIKGDDNKFAPLADGKYCAVVVAAEDGTATSKAGHDYEYVNVQFKIVGGANDNRRVFKRYIYSHSNSQPAGDIGQKGLKSIFVAQGNSGRLTCDALEGSGACIEIVLRTPKEGNNGYEPRQEVAFVNPCKNCPTDAGSDAGSETSSAGDIW